MSTPNFRFQRFVVWHDRSSMRVGTDGVLLGALSPIAHLPSNPHILDIGTGCGLVALMIAQRTETLSPHIVGIDIDEASVQQASDNFGNSPWSANLSASCSPLQSFASEQNFNLIVSNPPFFQNALRAPNKARSQARHTDTLPFSDLIQCATNLLAEDGSLCLILPYETKEKIIYLASESHLYPSRLLAIRTKPQGPLRRLLLTLTRTNQGEIAEIPFCVESESSPRSPEYTSATKDFYL